MMILGEDHFWRPKVSTSKVSNNKILHDEYGKSTEGKDILSMVIMIKLLIFTNI